VSLAYTLIYLVKGSLPWDDLFGSSSQPLDRQSLAKSKINFAPAHRLLRSIAAFYHTYWVWKNLPQFRRLITMGIFKLSIPIPYSNSLQRGTPVPPLGVADANYNPLSLWCFIVKYKLSPNFFPPCAAVQTTDFIMCPFSDRMHHYCIITL